MGVQWCYKRRWNIDIVLLSKDPNARVNFEACPKLSGFAPRRRQAGLTCGGHTGAKGLKRNDGRMWWKVCPACPWDTPCAVSLRSACGCSGWGSWGGVSRSHTLHTCCARDTPELSPGHTTCSFFSMISCNMIPRCLLQQVSAGFGYMWHRAGGWAKA